MLNTMKGRGTKEDPYQITTLKQLQEVHRDLSSHYLLTSNINAEETRGWNNGSGFKPIGHNDDAFDGYFNGDNYEITNLFIERPEDEHVGMFSYNQGHIANVNLTNATIRGDRYVGGLVGRNAYSGTAESSYVQGDVLGNRCVGGLAGNNSLGGTLEFLFVRGDVSGNNYVGGLSGVNAGGLVESSYALGDVSGQGNVGGLVGANGGGEINSSYAVGDVSGDDEHVGGLLGRDYGMGSGIDSSFVMFNEDNYNISERPDLVMSKDDFIISYIVDINTLYVHIKDKIYSSTELSTIELQELIEVFEHFLVDVSKGFKASVVADKFTI